MKKACFMNGTERNALVENKSAGSSAKLSVGFKFGRAEHLGGGKKKKRFCMKDYPEACATQQNSSEHTILLVKA
eukprot:6202181-Pleurochrysis_carterae.AAC.1